MDPVRNSSSMKHFPIDMQFLFHTDIFKLINTNSKIFRNGAKNFPNKLYNNRINNNLSRMHNRKWISYKTNTKETRTTIRDIIFPWLVSIKMFRYTFRPCAIVHKYSMYIHTNSRVP